MLKSAFPLLWRASFLAITAASPALAQSGPGVSAREQQEQAGQAGDGQVEEIIVTARFREESLQDVPAAISVFSASDIAQGGITDYSQLAARSPGLDMADRGPSQKTPALRGVARVSDLEDQSISSPVVATYIDEVSIVGLTASQRDVPTFDIEQIEVLRGPQGTLYGEASMAGTVKYRSAQPRADELGARLQGTLSQIEEGGTSYSIAGALNLPLIRDVLAVRIVGLYDYDAGFIDNLITGERDVNDVRRHGGRVLVRWTPNHRLSVAAGYHIDNLNRGFSWIEDFPGDRHVITDDPLVGAARTVDYGHDDSDLVTLRVDYAFDWATVSSITGYYKRDSATYATDNKVADGLRSLLQLPFRPDAELDNENRSRSTSQELRLVTTGDGPWDLTLGAFYKDSQTRSRVRAYSDFLVPVTGTDLFTDFPFSLDGEQYSVFGELGYRLSEKWQLRGGARYYSETLDVDVRASFSIPVPPLVLQDRLKINRLLPRAVVEYSPTTDSLLYASAAQGARNGTFNSPILISPIFNPGVPAGSEIVDADDLWTFELGSKNLLAGGRIRLNAALYHTRWSEPQIRIRGPVTGTAYFGNCSCNLEILGFDLEGEWRITKALRLSGGMSVIDSEADRDAIVQASNPPLVIFEGTDTPTVRKFSSTIALSYDRPITENWQLNAGVAWNHVSSARGYFLPETPSQRAAGFNNRLPGYDLVSFRIGASRGPISISAFVNNALNDKAYLYVTEGSLETVPLKPRTFGVTLSTAWGGM